MRFTGEHAYPFDDTNRAYRRFLDITREHFNVLGWTTDDGRPALTTLIDLQTGDAFTDAIVDSHTEPVDPHTPLVVDRDAALSAHGSSTVQPPLARTRRESSGTTAPSPPRNPPPCAPATKPTSRRALAHHCAPPRRAARRRPDRPDPDRLHTPASPPS